MDGNWTFYRCEATWEFDHLNFVDNELKQIIWLEHRNKKTQRGNKRITSLHCIDQLERRGKDAIPLYNLRTGVTDNHVRIMQMKGHFLSLIDCKCINFEKASVNLSLRLFAKLNFNLDILNFEMNYLQTCDACYQMQLWSFFFSFISLCRFSITGSDVLCWSF